jgi:hypothetical protein
VTDSKGEHMLLRGLFLLFAPVRVVLAALALAVGFITGDDTKVDWKKVITVGLEAGAKL